MADAPEELVKTIKKPFQVAREWLDKIPERKREYTDMHAKMVDAANESFRKESEKKRGTSMKNTGSSQGSSGKPIKRKPTPRKGAQRK